MIESVHFRRIIKEIIVIVHSFESMKSVTQRELQQEVGKEWMHKVVFLPTLIDHLL